MERETGQEGKLTDRGAAGMRRSKEKGARKGEESWRGGGKRGEGKGKGEWRSRRGSGQSNEWKSRGNRDQASSDSSGMLALENQVSPEKMNEWFAAAAAKASEQPKKK